MSEPIQLYVYDLSNGLARQWGQALTGRPVEGIWHTSLVLFGLEVFYGQGISIISPPGTTHHGVPVKTLAMGDTQLDRATFLEYIEGLKEVYSAERYHLLDWNCNSFTNDALGFLNGRSIPEDIINLPRDILATPFGQSMRPMIDQMFSGRNGPPASTAVQSLLPPGAPSTDPSQQSLGSNLAICTSPASLRSTLTASPAVAVMFTSASCPPCNAIKPYFEELARTHGAGAKRIEFVLVETGVGAGAEVAREPEFGGPVRATPTFVFFAHGKKTSECKGADRGELKTQVQLLEMEVYPPHPHSRLSLPVLTKLSTTLAPVTYPTFPPLPSLSSKLASFLTPVTSLAPTTKSALTVNSIAYLSSLPAPPAPPSTKPLPPALIASWMNATNDALDHLPQAEWFPVIDLLRLALARDLGRLSTSPEFVAALPQIITKATSSLDQATKPLVLTLVRFVSNILPSPALLTVLLAPTTLGNLTNVIVRALLEEDKGVRNAGAGLAWSVVGRVWSARAAGQDEQPCTGEEWQVEVASAVLEALGSEEESADVVHRLTATLGLLLYQSPHVEAIKSLLEVLTAKETLRSKSELVKGQKEIEALLSEVETLCG